VDHAGDRDCNWEVNQDSLKTIEPFVEFVDAKNITLYVEGSEDTEASALIAEYIESAPDDEKKKLLEAARVGLLQVVGVTRWPITPPGVPRIKSAKHLKKVPQRAEDPANSLAKASHPRSSGDGRWTDLASHIPGRR